MVNKILIEICSQEPCDFSHGRFSSENYSSSPLTIIVCCVLLFGGWLGFLAIDMLLFAFFRITIASKLSDDEDFAKSEILTGVAYSILIAVFIALITFVIPGNLIIRLL